MAKIKTTTNRAGEHLVKNFDKGTITRVENYSIPDGAASESLNWMTLGDHIELRRGRTLLGANEATAGHISGLIVASRFDGTEVAFRSRDRKIEYYDSTTELWVESTTSNILPLAASGEDFCFGTYHSLAGAMVYGSSKNSGFYKIPIANPSSVVDQSITTFRGKFRIKQGRTFLWGRKDSSGGFDQTGLYGSWIDKDELSDFDTVSAETGFTGAVNGVNTTYTIATLAQRTGARTVMYVSVYATTGVGVETFRDDRSGNLVSNYGGTGTINYATGAISVTFINPPTSGSVQVDYYYEDSTSATAGSGDGAILDFSKATPRVAGQGFVFRQDDGGSDLQGVFSLGDTEYCLHSKKTWALKLSSDDTAATNLIYRDRVGIPYWRAACDTGDGIYYIDAIDGSEPVIRILEVGYNNAEVIPKSISKQLILSDYRFDTGVVFEWGVYICVACRTSDSTTNNRLLLYHKLWQTWDFYDYRCSTLAILNGALIAGDSASENVFTLFSDLTDEDVEIPNYWTSGQMLLDSEGTKYANIFRVKGNIQSGQTLDIQVSYDNGQFATVKTISGDGSYVDGSQRVLIGSTTLGSTEVGGGSAGIEASPYEDEFNINTPYMERVRVRFVATGVGYVSVSEFGFKDIRAKSRRAIPRYVVE